MNNCCFIGRLTRDPQLKYLPNNTPVCDFGIAINERFKNGDEWAERPVYLDCSSFGQIAEGINNYFGKGKKIGLICSARFEQWQDKQTGTNKSKVKFVVNKWHFVESKLNNETMSQSIASEQKTVDAPHKSLDDDEIPF